MRSALQADRVVTNPTRGAEQWRVAMFALTNMFVKMYRMFSLEDELGPTAILIYTTVSVANVQKLMRERHIAPEHAGLGDVPRGMIVPISRSAVAAATGLPRETVRRQVAQMIELGMLQEDPRGGIVTAPDFAAAQGLEKMLEPLLTDFARTTEALLRAGVLEAQASRAAPPAMAPAATVAGAPLLRAVS